MRMAEKKGTRTALVGVAAAVSGLWPAIADAPLVPRTAHPPAQSAPSDAIRVETEVMRVPELTGGLVRQATPRRPPARRKHPVALAVRAIRAFFGSGRYRPQPWPRPRVERARTVIEDGSTGSSATAR